MHKHMGQQLRAAFGEPKRGNDECDWWQFDRDDVPPLRVCLDAIVDGTVAHVLIFDPSRPVELQELDMLARTPADAERIIAKISELRRSPSQPTPPSG